MTHHAFTTTITLPDETEQEVTVTYAYQPGYKGDYTDPPEPVSVDIQSVTPDVPAECYDALAEEAFEDYDGYLADAAEYRAELRRDV